MTRKRLLMGAGILVALLAVVAIACGDDDDDNAEAEAEAQLCSDLTTLRAADAAFDTLDENSTIDEIQATNQSYNDALDDVVSSSQDVASIRSEPIEDAYDDLDQAISDIPGESTITEALASIEDELTAVDAAYASAFSGLTCP